MASVGAFEVSRLREEGGTECEWVVEIIGRETTGAGPLREAEKEEVEETGPLLVRAGASLVLSPGGSGWEGKKVVEYKL